jgi:hypothetical protein
MLAQQADREQAKYSTPLAPDNAGKFYEYGTDGPQRVRCERGQGNR